ncbi:unnamed protein product [Arctia plantaginis]|uniref:Uncharacterized protein n=1 Tax=Arctia plantaginis TaxID=874455 RepID=A0A8S1BDT4_ARCPL|nr:unnamed protein product [Arctia plantaginis]
MSEQLDMETNNLCILEDTFEKFQAVSMYQEEECIMLPQKDLPNPAPSELEKQKSPPDINDVAVSSCKGMSISGNSMKVEDFAKKSLSSPCADLEQGSSLIVSTDKRQYNSEEYNYENDSDMVVSNSENVINQGNAIRESPTKNNAVVPRKRGRKPKKPSIQSEESSTTVSKNVENPDISSTPFSSDPETPETVNVVRKKRGRPRKIQPNDHSEMILNVSDKDQTSELSSAENNKCDDLIIKRSVRRKRSRPIKSMNTLPVVVNNVSQGNPLSFNIETVENSRLIEDASENLNVVTETSQKRKRKSVVSNQEKTEINDNDVNPDSSKILSNNISDNDDLDDICLSKLKRAPDQGNVCKLNEENTGIESKKDAYEDNNSENIGQLTKPKKKRGRPKKNQTTDSLSQLIERSEPVADYVPLNESSNIKSDEADDTCLSKFKAIKSDSTVTESIPEITYEETQLSMDPKVETQKVHVIENVVLNVPTTESQVSDLGQSNTECNETPIKRNTKMPVMADFEYNIDTVLSNENTGGVTDDSLLIEDTSKRPVRRKIKKYKYEEESDEDPFANIELSDDDEPRRGRRNNKYYSDDEYIPGKRGNDAVQTSTDTELSCNEINDISDDNKKQKRKKLRKRSDNQSPRKRGKKDEQKTEATTNEQSQKNHQTGDVEICMDPTVIKTSDSESQHSQPSQLWGNTTEFENFLAKKIQGTNLKIKKVSSNVPTESNKIDIPILNPEAKKTIEMCTQTTNIPTLSIAVQTDTSYDIPIKENIPLTSEQSEKACYFLNSIVKTTAELGLLMTQKSEDFIKKKINTSHVTDTVKMDYCVKKSFLLFKLAKHNLLQMEEDLSRQYDQFLEANNLTRCREEQKNIIATTKEANSDSDCEIVDVKPFPQTKAIRKDSGKPAFNPKTVFLNKELSIKIAKKPNENKKLDIKGRHTVWINDTVMVKKVKPTQSFLAQDSRNKKPPDNYFTTEMVSDFFKNYNRERALSACAPFVTRDWLNVYEECVCNYFVVKPLQYNTDDNCSNDGFNINTDESTTTISEPSSNLSAKMRVVSSPDTLFTLCFLKVKNLLCCNGFNHFKEVTHEIRCKLTDDKKAPVSLFRLCLKTINETAIKSKKTSETSIYSTNSIVDSFTSTTVNTTPPLESTCHKTKMCLNTALPLKSLCHRKIVQLTATKTIIACDIGKEDFYTVLPLKSLCHRKIVVLLGNSTSKILNGQYKNNFDIPCNLVESNKSLSTNSKEIVLQTDGAKNEIKTLFSLCVAYIQKMWCTMENDRCILTPKSLKDIAFKNIKYLLYTTDFLKTLEHNEQPSIEGLMINCVNTLSEEAFLNLEHCNVDIPNSTEYLDNHFDNEDNFEPDLTDGEEDHTEPDLTDGEEDHTEPSWVTKVQMQELRSCAQVSNTDVAEQQKLEPIITQIKLEPLDEISDNLLDSIPVKSEPVPGPDEMTIIPDVKSEIEELTRVGPIHRQNSSSYDVDAFEQFVTSSKLMQALSKNNTEEIYSQSSARVRRQHEPDYYEENDADMLDLLVPHTYEPMSTQTAKGSLMESSSDESSKNIKSNSKKVVGKRPRKKPRKSEQKLNNKDKNTTIPAPSLTITPDPTIAPDPTPVHVPTSSPVPTPKEKQKGQNSEVAILTRRMKEKIRQEDKQNESSDSENENITVRLRSKEKRDSSDQTKDKAKANTNANNSKGKNNEIQCNNVDSTDQIDESLGTFTGFTSIETNEMSNYEKYMKFVYNKVIPSKEDEIEKGIEVLESSPAAKNIENNKSTETSVINTNEPVELLECEPTLPIFDESRAKVKKEKKTKTKIIEGNIPSVVTTTKVPLASTMQPFIERHGWHCYPLDSKDSKLYHDACIILEKLPETFVQTYFEYQNIGTKDKSDEEINRLTNLNSLNRLTHGKDRKPQNSSKRENKNDQPAQVSEDENPTINVLHSEHFDELMPSDDEFPSIENEVPPPVLRQTENTLAKNLLMNDNDSEEENSVEVKTEPKENSVASKKPEPLYKKKCAVIMEEPTDLMLTADKMMNKELTLLHAPVVMDNKIKIIPSTGPVTRHSKKSQLKASPTNNKVNTKEDSSSEEEKQWVSTKEKLLKKMGKKETTSADDAKRAKLVTEFIERREINPSSRKRRGVRARRSGKKFLERQKQLRVLQHELFGETSTDPTVSKRSVAAWKGRRNIRKVLDKKSLTRSTVIANMEEFERKRRLNARQTKLRELLGCEEGVNVLVINDEVCLEYDFEEHRPVVTIHPFFTKVMKAHQYEGVKFMWDACFESLADIKAGHAGGGCILAHCMGLGKTLQVLALLHTVLTHPRVGMHRVLVCCPLSTVLNWVDEIHKWIGPVTNQIKVFELSKLKKTYERAYQLEDWYNGGGIFIIGYELFRSLSTLDPLLDDVRPTIINKIRTALLDPGPDIIVCDEGHLLKNDCSVLAVSMSRVVTKRRIILTGTPMQNNLREYYCMVNFVKPNLLGTYSEYSNRFENPIMNGQHRDSREEDIKLMKARTHILHKVLEGCLQRQEVSVLYPYLPKKHEYTVFITLTKCQWDLYKHYLNHYSRQMKQHSILKDFHILQKIWSHPQVLHNFQTKVQDSKSKIKLEKLEDDLATEDQEDIKEVATEMWWLQYLEGGNMLDSLEASNKFVAVFRILDECVALGDKVLIFSTSLFCLDALEYFLKKINKWSLGQEYYRLDGSVPAEVRQKWCREFNADNNINTRLFLVSTRAGCLGLNMTAANRVIIMDTSWNPAHDIQSIFRVYRFGQKKDCFIYRLVAMGTMEQKIYERAVTKQAVACRVVDEQQIDRHYNMAELTELYRYDEAGACVAPGVAVGVSDVALLRVARDAALHAVHEHDSLLRSSEQGLPEHERAAAWMQFQQEQAHKQMENKLIANIPKISLKRLQGNNYTQSFELDDIKIKSEEIKTEDTSEDFVPPNEVKSKKGKKISKIVVPVPTTAKSKVRVARSTRQTSKGGSFEEPSTSQSHSKYMDKKDNNEETMVNKITDILIKHNFHNKTRNTDISNLVSKVRKIVNQGFIFNEDTDDLTSSIAKVLLEKPISMPSFTGIMCESINNSYCPQVVEDQCEQILSTQIIEDKVNEVKTTESKVTDNRRKRKAAIAAEKHIDSMAQDIIINLDDDFDTTDTDFIPDGINKSERPPINQRKIIKESTSKRTTDEEGEQRNIITPPLRYSTEDESTLVEADQPRTRIITPILRVRAGPKTFKNKMKNKFLEQVNSADRSTEEQSNGILLSEDCESESLGNNNVPEATPTPAPTSLGDDEVLPLPLSLLTNKNFINIVAHTYLNDNPMLDADAATLAARYSTFKALKEVEQTGKGITSGPIYDIAVKVVGKELFSRMYSTNSKTNTPSVDEDNVTIELKGKMREMNKEKLTEVRKEKSRKRKIQNSNTSSSETVQITAHEPSTNQCTNGNVVPVGLIKTTGGIESNEFASSECILPDDDDDDMHIVPHALPALPQMQPVPPDQPLPAAPSTTMPTNSQILLDRLLAVKKTDLKKKPRNVIKIVLPPNVSKGNGSQSKVTPSQPPPTMSNDTICLDSDEEEMITPTVIADPAPVPVPLTVEPPPKVLSTPSNVIPITSAQSMPKTPLMLHQVASTGSAPQYVLVPTNAVSTVPKVVTKAKPVPQKDKPIIKPVEAVQSTTTPSATCLNKIKQARCKPGDIIRISEKGDIEVLQVSKRKTSTGTKASRSDNKTKPTQSDITKLKSSNSAEKPKSSNSTEKPKSSNSTEKPKSSNNTEKPKPSECDVAKSKPQIRSYSLSSSSSESRPSSPVENNPLSIFKNVVHIQAADDKPSSASEYKSKPTKTQKSGDASIYVQHVYVPDCKNSTKIPAKAAATQNKESIPKTTKEAKSSGNTIKIEKVPAKKAINTLVIKKSLTTKPNKTTENKSPLAPGLKAASDELNSKNNKVIHTVDLTHFSNVTAGSGPSVLKTKIEAKKRVSAAETSAPKKKKPELPTLKDFSLDDIDDIIELD